MTEIPPRATSPALPGTKPGSAPDVWTVVAIAIVAYIFASVIHEGLGHGGSCVLTHGKPIAMSTVHFECEREGKLVAASGTVANLAAGILFWLASRAVPRATRLRYFLWLSMTVNLLTAGGYFLFSGIGNIGDWAAVVEGLRPPWLWRVGLTILGVASYLLFVWIALREMQPFLSQKQPERWQRAKTLSLVPISRVGFFTVWPDCLIRWG